MRTNMRTVRTEEEMAARRITSDEAAALRPKIKITKQFDKDAKGESTKLHRWSVGEVVQLPESQREHVIKQGWGVLVK